MAPRLALAGLLLLALPVPAAGQVVLKRAGVQVMRVPAGLTTFVDAGRLAAAGELPAGSRAIRPAGLFRLPAPRVGATWCRYQTTGECFYTVPAMPMGRGARDPMVVWSETLPRYRPPPPPPPEPPAPFVD